MSFLNNLFKKKPLLTKEALIKIVKDHAAKMLDDDNSVVIKSTWFKSSGFTEELFNTIDVQHALLFEREIMCLSGTMINILNNKDGRGLLRDVIVELGTINWGLVGWTGIKDITTHQFFDIIYIRHQFYMGELMSHMKSKNHNAYSILFHLYNPMSNIEKEVQKNLPINAQIIMDEYLNLRFKMVTMPRLMNEVIYPLIR